MATTRYDRFVAASSASFSTTTTPSIHGQHLTLRKQDRTLATVPKPHDSYDTTGRDAYRVSQTLTGPDACHKVGLDKVGITGITTIYRNLSYEELWQHEVENREGHVAKAEYGETFAVDTGKYTGRSPKDRFIVKNPGSPSDQNIDWNDINQPCAPEVFDTLFDRAVKYMNTRKTAYVFDGYCGANKATQKKIRFIHEVAWQQHFGTC